MAATIKQLYFYPIKSFRGFAVSELNVSPQGARLDREWMIVDEKNEFLTQRQIPELARIGVAMDEVEIELSQQGFGSIDFGLEETEGDAFTVKVWKSEVPALKVSAEVSNWLSEVVGRKVNLVKLAREATRRFVDDSPLLVLSMGSMNLLEANAKKSFSVTRFRPNIVVDGVAAHAEDGWPAFKVGSIPFVALEPCTRCRITTVHPLTGEVGPEPLKTLGTYRRLEKGISFGFYFAPQGEGRIKVADALTLN